MLSSASALPLILTEEPSGDGTAGSIIESVNELVVANQIVVAVVVVVLEPFNSETVVVVTSIFRELFNVAVTVVVVVTMVVGFVGKAGAPGLIPLDAGLGVKIFWAIVTVVVVSPFAVVETAIAVVVIVVPVTVIAEAPGRGSMLVVSVVVVVPMTPTEELFDAAYNPKGGYH